MKVICITEKLDGLTLNKSYDADSDFGNGYKIINDNGEKKLYPSYHFSSVDYLENKMKVICITDKIDELTLNKSYDVENKSGIYYFILNDNGDCHLYPSYYFENADYFEKEETVRGIVLPKELLQEDVVNQPSHYTAGGIETIDFIKAKLSPEGYIGYCMGNVIKYTTRYGLKNGVEDLQKAQVYLNWAIEELSKEKQQDLL